MVKITNALKIWDVGLGSTSLPDCFFQDVQNRLIVVDAVCVKSAVKSFGGGLSEYHLYFGTNICSFDSFVYLLPDACKLPLCGKIFKK